MARMSDDDLLSFLQTQEDDAAQYQNGPLREQRDRAIKEYFQRPYGNEEPGWSQYVGSTVQDTVEWMLPDLLKPFVTNDKAVEFEATRKGEEQHAKDATRGVNHVFYEQNNGFMILLTAFKDALMVKNCAVHWRAETTRKRVRRPFRELTEDAVQALMNEIAADPENNLDSAEDIEVDEVDEPTERPKVLQLPGVPPMPYRNTDGSAVTELVHTGKLSWIVEGRKVRVDAFEPENLGIQGAWTSPLLEDCPYVVRWMETTLSDLNAMGLTRKGRKVKVEARDLAASQAPANNGIDDAYRRNRTGDASADARPRADGSVAEDESQTVGWIRFEWVLVDKDGDGIAERRQIIRLDNQILSDEEWDEVPIATGSPIVVQHRWDGQSVAETVSDIQLLDTELMRGVINNAYAANNPRKTVLVDMNGAPFADVGDLLDGRPGGVTRVRGASLTGAISYDVTPYVGNQMEPLLQRVDQLTEKRTGVTKTRQGMDPNILRGDRTLGESRMLDDASKQRLNLICRVMAECVVKPIMKGILGLLTSGDFDPLFFKLRGEYVAIDPNEWQQHYTLKTNVGLGTGDEEKQLAVLMGVRQTQMQLAQSPIGPGMVTPRQLYNTNARILELGGLQNTGEFFLEPPEEAKMPSPPPPPPPWQLQAKQMELQAQKEQAGVDQQAELAKIQLDAQKKLEEAKLQNEVQMANDERDARQAALEAHYADQLEALKATIEKYKVDVQARTSILVARIAHPEAEASNLDVDMETGEVFENDPMAPVMAALQEIYRAQNAPAEVVRHPETGDVVAVRKNGVERPVVRDAAGRVTGVA